MLLYLAIVLFVVYFYLRVVKPHSYWKIKNVPFVKPRLVVGNFGNFFFRRKNIAEVIEDIYNSMNQRYFGIYQFLQPTLYIKDLDLIKQLAVKDFDYFVDHRPFITEDIDPFIGKNLFALQGQRWRNMRSVLSPAFTGSKMRLMYTLMYDCAEQFIDYFHKESTKSPKPLDVEFKDIITRFANDVIATCAFGVKCDSIRDPENEFYINGKDAANFTGIRNLKFFGYTISPALMKLFRVKIFTEKSNSFFRNLVQNTMETREKNEIYRPDMIHLLMEAKKGKLKHEDKIFDNTAGYATVEESLLGKQTGNIEELTDDDYIAQAVIFFVAGFDSASTSMCHLAQELAINPDIQKRLQKEIDQAIENSKGILSYETITKLKYLDMCVSEGLRKWPIGAMADRVCNKTYKIKPKGNEEHTLILQKGDVVMFPIFGIHRDPKYFPDPEKFDPERFSDENKDKIQQTSYIPFSIGPRNCIGSRFVLLETKTVFVHILRKFDIVVTEKTQIPLKLKKGGFILHAEKGFWLGLKPRNIIH